MPTPTKYTYSISSDFSAGVATDALASEIETSSIVTVLDRIDTAGDDCDVWFKDVLSGGDQTTLNSLVAAHAGVGLAQPVQTVNLQPQTQVGLPNVTVQDVPDDCASFRRSWLIECLPTSITLRDICLNNDLVGPTGVTYVVSSFFGCATEAALGSELQIDLIDRDDVLGYFGPFGVPLSKLEGLTSTVGTFQVGEEIRSPTCRAKVLGVHTGYLDISYDRWDSDGHSANFGDGETITGQTSGATSVLSTPAFTEGGFIFLQRFIKDEALYRFKEHEQKPGGARQVPPGLYFRCAIYNAGTDVLWMDGSIDIGKK